MGKSWDEQINQMSLKMFQLAYILKGIRKYFSYFCIKHENMVSNDYNTTAIVKSDGAKYKLG